MTHPFREAFVWHMEKHGTTIKDMVERTGVSRDVINKLLSRPDSSTVVENGVLIAAYYGKTVNQFIARQDVGARESLDSLLALLTPEETRLLMLQIEGLVRGHARQ